MLSKGSSTFYICHQKVTAYENAEIMKWIKQKYMPSKGSGRIGKCRHIVVALPVFDVKG
jgi:hypothetical protein